MKLAAGLAFVAVLAVASPPAAALPILEPADATELAAALAEATEEQDICYGWVVEVDDQGGGSGGLDIGSSLGVDTDATDSAGRCSRYVVFVAQIVYTSSASEAEDRASFRIVSNIPDAPSSDDLRDLGVLGGGLLDEDDDQVLTNAVLALPALVAEAGLAPALELEPNTTPLPDGDGATGTPGSDWLRQHGSTLAFLVVVITGGVGWGAWVVWHDRPFSRRRRPPALVMEARHEE